MVALGLVAAEYNAPVSERMAEAAVEAAADAEAEIVRRIQVPGVYDAPLAADRLARRDAIDAVVVVGAIVEGDTNHDAVIGHATAESLQTVSLDRDTPVTLGVSGPGQSGAEARERVSKASEAVESAVALVEGLS